MLSTRAADVLRARVSQRILDVPGVNIGVQEIGDRARKEAVVTGIRFLTEQKVHAAVGDRLHEPGGIGPGPVQLLVVILVNPVRESRLSVFGRDAGESGKRVLPNIEAEPAQHRRRRSEIVSGEDISEDLVVFTDVVLLDEGVLERVAGVVGWYALGAAKVAGDVIDRSDGLLQDVLAENAVLRLCGWVIRYAAVMTIDR